MLAIVTMILEVSKRWHNYSGGRSNRSVYAELSKGIGGRPEYKSMITATDGHIYAFPWIEELGAGKESIHSIDTFPWINMEWLNKFRIGNANNNRRVKRSVNCFQN